MHLPHVSEDFIQFVWKFQLFDKQNLCLPNGQKLRIIHPGNQNRAGGPDFFNAKLYFEDTLWAGNVEIHPSSKQWEQHNHQKDKAYNNVILHVNYFEDSTAVLLQNGRKVPSISIGNKIFKKTLYRYQILQQKTSPFIPCQNLIQECSQFEFIQYYESLVVERLDRKIREIEQDLIYTGGDIELVFLHSLFKYFGAPINKDAFALLARSFTLNQLIKQQVSATQMESFLFGLADLLQDQDLYATKLGNEFAYTQKKYQLEVYCKQAQWQFAGTRPPNFPTLRIAQLAALLTKEIRLFSVLLEAKDLKSLYAIFNIELSKYWQTHFNFGNSSKKGTNSLSKTFINKLLINTVVPFLFFYGKYVGEEKYGNRGLDLLQEIDAEKNQVITKFKQLLAPCSNALESQALLELKQAYCQQYKCLECRLGFSLLKQEFN